MTDAESLREYLADRDVPCPGCGYNLRGLTGTHCPECDELLTITVGLAEPRLGIIIGVLAGLWSTFGTAMAVTGGMVTFSLFYGDWPPVRYWIPSLATLVLTGPFVWVFCRRSGRAWLRARSPEVRGAVVLWAWAAFIVSVTSWMLVVFLS